jgi:hypothetical protein
VVEPGSVFQWGNFPQWLSAFAALAIVGAAVKLLFHGRRTNIGISAESRHANGQWVLDVEVTLSPVGSCRVTPYWPEECEKCPGVITENDTDVWIATDRCPAEGESAYNEPYSHLWSKFHRKRRGMRERRKHWGCPNRKVPTISVLEMTFMDDADGKRLVEKPLAYAFNVFCAEFAEPQEQLRHTQVVPITTPRDEVIGWRVVLDVWIPKETWPIRWPNDDSWHWQVDDFVPFGPADGKLNAYNRGNTQPQTGP